MDAEEKQRRANRYYDRFSAVYDLLSPKSYYHKARTVAVERLGLKEGHSVLNIPVGTGQNLEYFQQYLQGTGLVLGVDISSGMLSKARQKVTKNSLVNVELLERNVSDIDDRCVHEHTNGKGFDAVLCDLGLSGFPDWKQVIDQLLSLISTGGKIAIMDWYFEKPSLRGDFIKWIGKGEVDRPIWQYLENNVNDFMVDSSFCRGGVFVASGVKR
jgi:ubiquinone/menaquinone biosynthesis C-methylase UbiE